MSFEMSRQILLAYISLELDAVSFREMTIPGTKDPGNIRSLEPAAKVPGNFRSGERRFLLGTFAPRS